MYGSKLNFSKEDVKVYDLTLDLARGDYTQHIDAEKVSRVDLENYLREKINSEILQGKTLYQAFRRNNLVLFEIMEEITNITIGENVLNSPFIDAFVEVKNRALGDKTAFYSEGGLLSVASFAGNHWDTNRQAIDVGAEVTLPSEWIYIHVYEDGYNHKVVLSNRPDMENFHNLPNYLCVSFNFSEFAVAMYLADCEILLGGE